MYRLGPLELVILCVCGSGFLVAVGLVVYFVTRSAAKAGIKDAQKENPPRENL